MISGAFLDAVTDLPRLRAAFLRLETEREETQRQTAERIEARKAETDADRDDDTGLIWTILVAGTLTERLVQLSERIETHQLAVIEALQANRDKLDRTEDELDIMLSEAHVLGDGRRVFKTRDGLQVFDEHGFAVSAEIIEPDAIDDRDPHWERFDRSRREHLRLSREREDLLTYQERLDRAQERIEQGTMTGTDADDLDRLLDDAPEAVRHYLPETDPAHRRVDLAPEASEQAANLHIGGPRLDSNDPESEGTLEIG